MSLQMLIYTLTLLTRSTELNTTINSSSPFEKLAQKISNLEPELIIGTTSTLVDNFDKNVTSVTNKTVTTPNDIVSIEVSPGPETSFKYRKPSKTTPFSKKRTWARQKPRRGYPSKSFRIKGPPRKPHRLFQPIKGR